MSFLQVMLQSAHRDSPTLNGISLAVNNPLKKSPVSAQISMTSTKPGSIEDAARVGVFAQDFVIEENIPSISVNCIQEESTLSTLMQCMVVDESKIVLPVPVKNLRLPSRLAINTTLLYRVGKTPESMKQLKTMVQLFGENNIYFFNALQVGGLTSSQTRDILSEYGITLVNYMETNGRDAEAMDFARITHLIDNRHRCLLKMQTVAGYIRQCYCVTHNVDRIFSRSLNVRLFDNWTLALDSLIEGLKIPLVRYDATDCWSCEDEDCRGECCDPALEPVNMLMMSETMAIKSAEEDKFTVVSWNVRSLKSCYLAGSFSTFLKTTEAQFVFLQEVSASTSTIVGLPGFTGLLRSCGFLYCYWYPCKQKPHYSGTALLARIKPDLVIKGLLGTEGGDQTPNREGRTITAIYGRKIFVGAYFPTLTFQDARQEEKAAKRSNYQEQYRRHLEHPIFKGMDVILTGDLNTTRTDDDLTFNRKNSKPIPADFPSTTLLEREFLERTLQDFCLIDAAKYPKNDHRYTFFGSHQSLVGLRMRLDYFLIPSKYYQTSSTLPIFKVLTEYAGSDHYPVELQLFSNILEISPSVSTSRMLESALTEKFCSIEDFDKVCLNSDVFKPKCWSVTRKHLGFICNHENKCLYNHDCVCEEVNCSYDCEEMLQFMSLPSNKKVRSRIAKALCSRNILTIPHSNISPVDLQCGKLLSQVALLQQPLHEFTKTTLFESIISTLSTLGLSIETEDKDKVTDVETIATSFSAIQIVEVLDELSPVIPAAVPQILSLVTVVENVTSTLATNIPLEEGDGVVEDVADDDNIVLDTPMAKVIDPLAESLAILNKIFSTLCLDDFEVSAELQHALLNIPSLAASPLGKTQNFITQIEKLELYKTEVPQQLRDELWRAIQTLYCIWSQYGDITRTFQHSPRYAGAWDTLTEEDHVQFRAYYYSVRNISRTLDQLSVTGTFCDKSVLQVIQHLYTPKDVCAPTFVEDDRTEELEEVEQLNSVVNSRRRIFCPHVKVQVNNSTESILSLVDTGATYCIITTKYLRSIMSSEEITRRSIKTRIKLLVANGQVTKPLQKILLEFKIGDTSFENEFFIMDVEASYQLILGCSFLTTRDVQLNFRDQSLTIPNANSNVSKIDTLDKADARMDVIAPFAILGTDPCRSTIPLYCVEEMVIEPYSEANVFVQMSKEDSETYHDKFGEVYYAGLPTQFGVLRGATGFNYVNKNSTLGYTVINPSSVSVTIPRNIRLAEFYSCIPECYGVVFRLDDLGADDESSTPPLDTAEPVTDSGLSTNFVKVGPDVLEGVNIPACVGIDYTADGGFREIKPARLIPDFAEVEIVEKFKLMGLSDLSLNPNKETPRGCTLPPELATYYFQMQAKREAAYSKQNDAPFPAKYYTASIPWTGQPRQAGLRPYSPEMIDVYKKELNPFIECGVLVPSMSPWRSAVMLVVKPDGKSWRVVSDFRIANAQVTKRNWPLPRIEATLTAIAGAKYFSSIDQNNAYFQIPLADQRSRDWATIQTPIGVFSYTRCPQGYINSQADLMRFLDLYVMSGLSWKCCLAYCDDTIIWSRTVEQHIQDIDSVLCRIEFFGIQLKASKCEFFVPQLIFLGYEISANGIRPSPVKTSAIMKLPLPQSAKDIRGYCAKLGYYHHNIPGLAQKIARLTDLQKHDVTWPHKYTVEEEDEFNESKRLVCSDETMVAIRDPQYRLAIDADASKRGLGASLVQLSKPERAIMHASRKLTPVERLYHGYALEVLAAVFAVSVFRPWVCFNEFILRIDCIALRWLMRTDQSSMFIRWVMLLCEYVFIIKHRPGKSAPHVDYTSRHPVNEEGYYGEKSIEKLYFPATTDKELVRKVNEAIESDNWESVLAIGLAETSYVLTLPQNIQDVDVLHVGDKTFLEIFTTTQRLIYLVEADGARQHLVEQLFTSVERSTENVVNISYADLLNVFCATPYTKIHSIPYLVKPKQSRFARSNKPPRFYTMVSMDTPSLPIPLWHPRSIVLDLHNKVPWLHLSRQEQVNVLVEKKKQTLIAKDCTVLVHQSVGGAMTISFANNLTLDTYLVPMLSSAMLTTFDFAKHEADKHQLLDPRLWNYAGFVTVVPEVIRANSIIQYDDNIDNLCLFTIRPVRKKEVVSVSLKNVIDVVFQICFEIDDSFSQHNLLTQVIPYEPMYADTPWSLLGNDEQSEVLRKVVEHVNTSNKLFCVKKEEGEFGVYTRTFIPKNHLVGYYEGEEINGDEVKSRYKNKNDAIYLFKKRKWQYVDAVDPRKANLTRFINTPGVSERPNCVAIYRPRVKRLLVSTLRILVPDEQLLISYGRNYNFPDGSRRMSNNNEIRKMYSLRGKRNINVADLRKNPPLKELIIPKESELYDNSDTESDLEVVEIPKSLIEKESLLSRINETLLRAEVVKDSLLEVIRVILDLKNELSSDITESLVTHKRKRMDSLSVVSNELENFDTNWTPLSLKKPRVEMFNENGLAFTDKDLFKETLTRQKLKAFHNIQQELPYLFKDPNVDQPAKQYQIDDSVFNQEDLKDPLDAHVLQQPVVEKILSPSPLRYYFPHLCPLAVEDIIQHLQVKNMRKLDDMVSEIEDQLFANRGTFELFKLWLLKDEQAQKIISSLRNSDPMVPSSWLLQNFVFRDNLLWKINVVQPRRHNINTQPFKAESVYVPNIAGLRETILRYHHGVLISAHPGISEMHYKIRCTYYWPGCRQNCSQWVHACDLCASRKLPASGKIGLTVPNWMPKDAWPFHTILIDFVKGLPECAGYTCLCTIICVFTRYPFAFPCDCENMENAAESIKKVICAVPFQIVSIISDRGTSFTGSITKILSDELDIKLIYTSTNSPVGGVEIFNRYLIVTISLLLLSPERRNLWIRYVDPCLYCFRSAVGFGYSPFKMVFGIQPPNPLDVLLDLHRPEEYKTYSSSFTKEMRSVYEAARIIKQRCTILQTMYHNLGRESVVYQKGDFVRCRQKANPSKASPRHTVFGVVVKHEPGCGFALVRIYFRGAWVVDTIRVRNMTPYHPYDVEHFTTAPRKYTDIVPPPLDGSTAEIVYDKEEDVEENVEETSKPVSMLPFKTGSDCIVGNFVVIPSHLWPDIERDGMPYSIARCVKILNGTHGVFQRYGNLHGKLGLQRILSPGFIDQKDGKYYYTRNPRKGSIPYTNNLSSVHFTRLVVPDDPILLSDLLIVFGSLKADSTTPAEVIQAVAKLLPSITTNNAAQQNKKQ